MADIVARDARANCPDVVKLHACGCPNRCGVAQLAGIGGLEMGARLAPDWLLHSCVGAIVTGEARCRDLAVVHGGDHRPALHARIVAILAEIAGEDMGLQFA